MKDADLQQLIFQQIKNKLPQHLSMVDEIADLLGISTDSSYRRIRGAKAISLDEVQVLATHYQISLDHLLQHNGSSFIFRDNLIGKEENHFGDGVEFHLQALRQFQASGTDLDVIYFSRDIAIYYFFQFPELLSFKLFYWMRTIFGNQELTRKKFLIADYIDMYPQKTSQAALVYSEIPSTEIWAIEHVNLTLQQVQFYKESSMFEDPAEIDIIYEKIGELINHIEAQAEIGKKFIHGKPVSGHAGAFHLYVNEFMVGGNHILARSDQRWTAFINHSIMNYLITDDPIFCEYMLGQVRNVIKKADLISQVGEKQRKIFFNRMRERVETSRRSDR